MSADEAPISPDIRDVVGALRIVPMRRRHLRTVAAIEERVYPRPWSAALIASEMAQRSTRRYTVATIGPLVIGYGGLMLVEDEGHVTTLTVDEAWQRKHVGALLLLDLVRVGLRAGVRHLTLEVRAGNEPAKALYRRFGFAPVGVRRNYYPETGEDAHVMWVHDVDQPPYLARLAALEGELEARR